MGPPGAQYSDEEAAAQYRVRGVIEALVRFRPWTRKPPSFDLVEVLGLLTEPFDGRCRPNQTPSPAGRIQGPLHQHRSGFVVGIERCE